MSKLLSVFVVEDTFSEISDVGVTLRGVMREIICPSETVEVKVEVARVLIRVADESVMLVDALFIDTGVVIGKVGSPCVLMSWGVCPRVTEDEEHGRSGNCHLGEFIICRTIYNHEKREQLIWNKIDNKMLIVKIKTYKL